MNHILGTLYSWPFVVGAIVGVVGHRVYSHGRARWLDQNRPNSDGSRHTVASFDRVWAGGLAAVIILGYVVLKINDTETKTVAIAERIGKCSEQFRGAISSRSNITTQDAQLSNQMSDYRDLMDAELGAYMDRIINPPADIRGLAASDPRTHQYRVDALRVLNDHSTRLREQIAAVAAERKRINGERLANPLPSPQC